MYLTSSMYFDKRSFLIGCQCQQFWWWRQILTWASKMASPLNVKYRDVTAFWRASPTWKPLLAQFSPIFHVLCQLCDRSQGQSQEGEPQGTHPPDPGEIHFAPLPPAANTVLLRTTYYNLLQAARCHVAETNSVFMCHTQKKLRVKCWCREACNHGNDFR